MSLQKRDLDALIHALSAGVHDDGHGWTFTLSNGVSLLVHATLTPHWLELRARTGELHYADPGRVIHPAAQARGLARVSKPLATPWTELRADVYLDDVELDARIAVACRDLSDLAHVVLSPDATSTDAERGAADEAVAALCAEAGWECRLSSAGGTQVVLPVGAGAILAAVEPSSDGLSLAATIDTLKGLPPPGKAAAAVLLLALADTVRTVGTAVRSSQDTADVVLTSAISPATSGGLDRAASALVVASRLYANVSPCVRDAALTTEYLSRHDLACRQASSPLVEADPCLQQP